MKLPAIWRKRRKDKKEYGNCYATVAGEDINLGTEDRNEARETLRSILIQKAAEASEPDVEDGGGGGGEAASGGQTPAPVPAALPTSPAPAPLLIVPELVNPGSGTNPPPASSDADARAEADATNAAAAETAGGAAANDNAAAADAFAMPPELIEGMLLQAGQAVVLMQLELQAWIIRKRTGKVTAPIDLSQPMAGKLIDAAAQGWVAQLKKWFPDIELCPPWVVAVGAPLLFLPAQLASAKDAPPEKPAENQADGPAQAVA